MKLRNAAALSLLLAVQSVGLGGCGGGSYAQAPQSSVPPPSPPPLPLSIAPMTATAGSADVALAVTTTTLVFVDTGVHHWSVIWSANGTDTDLGAVVVSNTQLSTIIPAALLASPGAAGVSVEQFDRVEGIVSYRSGPVTFSVTPAASSTSVVSPTLVTLGPKGTQQFVALLNGNNADATWEIEEGVAGGSITATGLYTVPAHTGVSHVIARFVADPSKNAAATVMAAASGFTETGSMSTPRSGHTATLLAGGKVLIAGGGYASAELFDPVTGTFTPTGNMTTARYGATATLLADGKVLITGGFGPGASSLPRLNSAELYDPLTGTFGPTGSMVVPRILHTATLMNNGKVLIAGGTWESGGGGAATPSAELYDPQSGTFSSTGGMHTDRARHTATLLPSGEVLVAGGWNGHAADSIDDPPWDPLFAELFDPTSGRFNLSSSMSTTRIGHKAIPLANEKVLILGGVPAVQNIREQLPDPRYGEFYDPVASTFSSLGNVIVSRSGNTATLLNNGKVLLAGGEDLARTVSTVELLDPNLASLSSTGSLVTQRKGHTATLLKDGRVLVTGGTDSNGVALATAEIYQ